MKWICYMCCSWWGIIQVFNMGKYFVVSLHTETKVSMKVMYTFKIVGQLLPLNACCCFFFSEYRFFSKICNYILSYCLKVMKCQTFIFSATEHHITTVPPTIWRLNLSVKIPKQIRNKHEGIDNSVNYRNDFFVLINKLAETTKRLLPTDMSTCYVSTTLPYRIYLSSIFKEDITT